MTKSNLQKSVRKHIRKEKSLIRSRFLSEEEKNKAVSLLYEKFAQEETKNSKKQESESKRKEEAKK